MSQKNIIKEYYKLAKPGIVYGNVFTTVAAFLFASRWSFFAGGLADMRFNLITLFFVTVLGISFVIGSACVFNNYLDRDIDEKMQRTQKRALVTGAISPRNALIYGSVLGILGLALLFFFVNILTAGIALFGFIFYVIIYGIAKRGSEWGALVGSVSGAVPIVVGYTAVTNHLDAEALILFVILALWQMPHFYAIAMYRLDEYKAAGIPVLPAQKGVKATKVYILLYIIAYIAATSALYSYCGSVLGGYFYLLSVSVFGYAWLWQAVKGFKAQDDRKWARRTFLFSLIVLVAFSITIALEPFFR